MGTLKVIFWIQKVSNHMVWFAVDCRAYWVMFNRLYHSFLWSAQQKLTNWLSVQIISTIIQVLVTLPEM